MQFADRLNRLLQLKSITAYQLAKDTGLSEGMIGHWRRGERMPSAENLVKLADYFDVSVDWLLCRTLDPQTKLVVGLSDEGEEIAAVVDKDADIKPSDLSDPNFIRMLRDMIREEFEEERRNKDTAKE